MIKKSISASGGENIRVDKFLSNHILTMTRTQIKKLFLEGLVQVNKSFENHLGLQFHKNHHQL